jgi:hypothetical protein
MRMGENKKKRQKQADINVPSMQGRMARCWIAQGFLKP